MPDDERKGRRLGDETKHRIADLAAGWTVDEPAPEPEAPRADAPRRKAKTVPPPPPGSAARKELEDKIVEVAKSPTAPPPVPAGARRAVREGDILGPVSHDGSGARGTKNDKSGSSIETNAASGVIGGTPAPVFDRAAIAAQRKALADKAASRSGGVPAINERSLASGSVPTLEGDAPLFKTDRKTGPNAALGGPSSPIGDRRTGPNASLGGVPAPAGDRRTGPNASMTGVPAPAGDRRTGPNASMTGVPAPAGDRRTGPNASMAGVPAPGGDRRTGPNASIAGPPPVPTSDRKSGPAPILPGDRSAANRTNVPPPRKPQAAAPTGPIGRGSPPTGAAIDKLPLRADATPVAGGQPPPLPPPPVIGHPRAQAPAVIIDDHALETIPELGPPPGMPPPPPPAKLTVPVGEFDHGQTIVEQDKLRIAHAQSTIKRDAANALLGLPEAAVTVVRQTPVELLLEETAQKVRTDASRSDNSGSSTSPFERGDPTIGERPDATIISFGDANASSTGTLRTTAALRRKRGIFGDVTYIGTVFLGVRRARRELEQLEGRQATRQTSRRHHLVTLGRTAVTSESFDHPALGPAREQLAAVEDERSQHAGHVLAADTELLRCRRDREAKAKQYQVDIAALDTELTTLVKKLDPLEKEAAAVKRKAVDLRDALRRIDNKIASTEASMVSVKGEKLDRAEIQAEVVTLRADRKSVQADEPKLAGELDALTPRIAAIEAARSEAQKKRSDLEKAELEDQRRIEELLTAIGAKRKVVDRAAADAEQLRDRTLFDLAERLYVDRPHDLTAQLAPIDDIDVELGEADRRMMELKEILGSVDKLKIARGLGVILLVVGGLGALIAWTIYLLA